jgi:aminoglycoside phosphotransferase (APT) family kinase protein
MIASVTDWVREVVSNLGIGPAATQWLRTTTWTDVVRIETSAGGLVAKAFTAARAGLSPGQLARKVHLVQTHLAPAADIRVPELLASFEFDEMAVVVSREAQPTAWSHQHHVAAVEALRRLHDSDVGAASGELHALMAITEPNRARVQNGVRPALGRCAEAEQVPRWISDIADRDEPWPDTLKPVHGDYVAANLLPLPDGKVAIVDWDLAGFGDPMWDLSFLCYSNADSDRRWLLPDYGHLSTQEADRLEFHQTMWDAFHALAP